MAKFKIVYEIEALDIATATAFAHEVLYMANLDVDKLTVVEFDSADKPVSKSGRTFGGGYSAGGYIPGPAINTEVNSRVAQHIQDQAREVSKLLQDAMNGSRVAESKLRERMLSSEAPEIIWQGNPVRDLPDGYTI